MPQEKATLEVVSAKEAELIKSRTCVFHLLKLSLFLSIFLSPFPFSFPLPLSFPGFAFSFNRNSTLAFSDGCLPQRKGHAVHNP